MARYESQRISDEQRRARRRAADECGQCGKPSKRFYLCFDCRDAQNKARARRLGRAA